MLNKLKNAVKLIDEFFFGASCIAMTLLCVAAVIMRYIIRNPIIWADEVQMILIVWAVFFGSSIAFRARGHIAVDVLFDELPRCVQRVLNVIIWCIVTYCVAWIGKLQVDRMLKMLASGQSTTVLNIPRWIVYAGVALACLLMLIGHIIVGIEDLKGLKKKGGDEE